MLHTQEPQKERKKKGRKEIFLSLILLDSITSFEGLSIDNGAYVDLACVSAFDF